MALTIPHYIRESITQSNDIRYKWDDWNLEEAEGPIDQELFTRLSGVSQRANLAFTIACAEWIVYRLKLLDDNPTPSQHLEAAWAQTIDVLYSFPWELTDEESWVGPIKGPLYRAMELVNGAIGEMVSDAEPALCSVSISSLTEHVITDPIPFERWRERVLQRLQRMYPLNTEDTLGEVVPREAVDPDYDFDPQQTESLVNSFLAGLNHMENPLLHSPSELVDAGFEGTPYIFDIEQDRRNRFEW